MIYEAKYHKNDIMILTINACNMTTVSIIRATIISVQLQFCKGRGHEIIKLDEERGS